MNSRGQDYEKTMISKKCKCLLSTTSSPDEYAQEIYEGLSGAKKSIPSKFFYDQRGSMLFERICELPEYYLTRTETMILGQAGPLLGRILQDTDCVVELGSGASTKTRLVLDLFGPDRNARYIPIDVSQVIVDVARDLCDAYKNLQVTGIVDTYESGLRHVKALDVGRKMVMFLGSSIGNFEMEEGRRFLADVLSSMNPGDRLLIGVDLVKDRAVLESAYNDAACVTGQFNLNVLRRINEELGGRFMLENFEHLAVYDGQNRRIEMYLKSLKAQSVRIEKLGMTVSLGEGELIHTEYSHKYVAAEFEYMLDSLGFDVEHTWKDGNDYYALMLASKPGN